MLDYVKSENVCLQADLCDFLDILVKEWRRIQNSSMKNSECKFEKDPEMKIESFVRHTELILDMFLCLKNETNLTFPEMPTMFEKNVAHMV